MYQKSWSNGSSKTIETDDSANRRPWQVRASMFFGSTVALLALATLTNR
jgi:hypothetical protein